MYYTKHVLLICTVAIINLYCSHYLLVAINAQWVSQAYMWPAMRKPTTIRLVCDLTHDEYTCRIVWLRVVGLNITIYGCNQEIYWFMKPGFIVLISQRASVPWLLGPFMLHKNQLWCTTNASSLTAKNELLI